MNFTVIFLKQTDKFTSQAELGVDAHYTGIVIAQKIYLKGASTKILQSITEAFLRKRHFLSYMFL